MSSNRFSTGGINSKIKMQKVKSKNWRKVKLEELGLDISDGNYSSKYPTKTDFVNKGVPFIRADNFMDGKISWIDMRYITPEKHKELQKGHLKKDDVLITTRGEIGKIAHIDDDAFVDANINAQIVRINTKDKINSRFFFYLLLRKSRSGYFQNIQTGTALQQLPVGILKNIEIELPPSTDQKRIADVLSAFDEKIEVNNKISKNLEEMAQAIFSEKLKMKSEKLPKGWEVKNVMEIVERLPVGKRYDNRTALPKGKVPILDQGQSGIIGFHNEEPSVKATVKNPVAVFSNHTCYYRLITYDFSCIQNVIPYVGINGYPTSFVYYLTKNKIKMSDYKGHWPEFAAQKFIVPPQELAVKFSEKIQPFIELISKNEKENQKLAALRDLLLPKLMSGEIRV